MITYKMNCPVWPGLGKLVEEMGELNVEFGKLIVNGGDTNYWDDRDLLDGIHNETADVLAAVAFFIEQNKLLDENRITERAQRKLEKFRHWKDTKQ